MKIQTFLNKLTIASLMLTSTASFVDAQNATVDIKAEKILNQYVTAIGGQEAIAKVENILSKSEMLFVERGLIISREISQNKENHFLVKVNSRHTGVIIRGFDGSTHWEQNKTSIRELNNEDKIGFLNEFAFMRFADWKKNLIGYTYLGMDTLEGGAFHCIAVKTIFGIDEKWYFNPSDYLLEYTIESLEMTQGSMSVVTKLEDYKEVDGVRHAFSRSIKMGDSNRKITFSSILHNQDVDPKIFEKPTLD
ncbi:MAG: hypothetical protein Q7V19_14260 [Bacteroidales bacterium]|nr:hypothetical protein [Bacteroidales bacterium]